MHYLALALGGRTVAEWQEVMSASEFLDWRVFFERHPFGFMRDNIHAAYISAIIANANRAKNQRPFKPNDFMVKPESQSKQDESWETIQTMIRMAKPKKKANG